MAYMVVTITVITIMDHTLAHVELDTDYRVMVEVVKVNLQPDFYCIYAC